MDYHDTEIQDCPTINTFIDKVPFNQFELFCLHVNIRSIIKNFTKLLLILDSCKSPIDAIVLTEVGISDNLSSLYNIDGYKMHTKLRSSKGGGIIVYIKNCLKFTQICTNTNSFENLFGTLKTANNNIVTLCALYRPPSTDKNIFISELSQILSKYSTTNTVILGDANVDLKLNNSIKNSYVDMLSEHGFIAGITDYTRIETRLDIITKSCIDHLFTRLTSMNPCTGAVGTVLADHRIILLACEDVRSHSVRACSHKRKTFYNDIKILSEELNNANWSAAYNFLCPDKIYSSLRNNFNNAYKNSLKYTQKKTKIKYAKPSWVKPYIINMSDIRDNLFNKWKKDPTNRCLRLKYNKIRNKINKILEYHRNKFYLKEINENKKNPRKLWQIINSICGRLSKSIDDIIVKAFDRRMYSYEVIANKFAQEFRDAVKAILPVCRTKLLNRNEYNRPANVSLYFKKATPQNVEKIIMNLNSRKAPGADEIKVVDVKSISSKISVSIANLINTSIATGKYPDDLKQSCVRPVHKKGKQNDISNYRPISLLSTFDKVFEKYVCEQIHKFYHEHKIIYPNQYGFQPHKSTTMLMSNFSDEINNHLDNRRHILALFIDFSRAFDTLNHKKLLEKLDNCGIRGPLLRWCSDYLKNRSYFVKIADKKSKILPITEGTAQGSVLGPLHFISYVNDMNNVLKHCTSYQYADDTCLIVADKNVTVALDKLQRDFDTLNKWCHDNHLVLNANKTKLIHIRSPHTLTYFNTNKKLIAHDHLCFHNQRQFCTCPKIESIDKHTYLGMVIDNNFNWLPHIHNICDKLRTFLANLYIIKKRIPYKILLLLYTSLAESIIDYGITSYARTFKTYLDKIKILQTRILKNIVSPSVKQQYKNNEIELFKHCKVLPIHSKFIYCILKEQYYNSDILNKIQHHIKTRQVSKEKLKTTLAYNTYGERTTRYLIPRLLNKIDTTNKNKITQNNIKNKLKLHVWNMFYSSADTVTIGA